MPVQYGYIFKIDRWIIMGKNESRARSKIIILYNKT